MFKLNKLSLILLCSVTLVGCSNLDNSYRLTQQNFQQYEEITKQYNIKENWWALYNDTELNRTVEQALINNKNLAKATIAVNRALYNANLLNAELVPTFNAATSSSAQRNINSSSSSSIKHEGSLGVSYTLDLWRRLADSASAAEWEHQATTQDLEATRQSLINAVVTTYYQIAYLNDAITASEEAIKYYLQVDTIMQNRLRQGVADSASTDQAQQSVLTARNNLINYQTQKKIAEQTLRNLLNLTPNDPLHIKYPHILNVKTVDVNLDVPVSAIANRPDVKAYQYRLVSSFKDLKATEKSWFPTITLGSSLSSAGNKINNTFNTPIAAGVLNINLPFLDWNHIKWNVKISETAYETAKLNFEQGITTALNDIDTNYFSYTQSIQNFGNLRKRYEYDQRITQYYRNRYEAGVSELREWLNAANSEKASQISILQAKYDVIQNENAIYSSMAGYYSTK